MAKLTRDDILHVAKLAKLNITDEEIQKYSDQLSAVIDYFSELSTIDTTNTEPTSQTTGLEDVLREDVVTSTQSLRQDQALSGTDNTYNGFFKVPAILEGRTDK